MFSSSKTDFMELENNIIDYKHFINVCPVFCCKIQQIQRCMVDHCEISPKYVGLLIFRAVVAT